MSEDEDLFNSSYWSIVRRTIGGMTFMDAFYDRFMSSSSEVRAMFAATEFSLQKKMLAKALLETAAFNPMREPEPHMVALAERHRALGIPPQMFDLWLECLLDTVRKYDSSSGEPVVDAWRSHLSHGVEFLRKGCTN